MLIKKKLKIMVASAIMLIQAARMARHPAVARACRYAAYKIQEIRETVSFGSQFHGLPHAASAQIAPSKSPRPRTGKVTIADL